MEANRGANTSWGASVCFQWFKGRGGVGHPKPRMRWFRLLDCGGRGWRLV